jgi:hypothetical protein
MAMIKNHSARDSVTRTQHIQVSYQSRRNNVICRTNRDAFLFFVVVQRVVFVVRRVVFVVRVWVFVVRRVGFVVWRVVFVVRRVNISSEGNAAHPVGCDSPLQIVME